MTKLRDGSEVLDPRLDRLVQFDERSRQFPVRELVKELPFRSFSWRPTMYLDQGTEGACVGYSMAHELVARPYMVQGVNKELAQHIYWEAQKIDPWPGGAYPGASPFYEGTSVLAGVKVLQRLGKVLEYRWAFSLEDVRRTIGYKGPVVFGLNWYTGMFDPDEHGQIRPTGRLAGGHAILGYRVDEKNERVWLHNSWGEDWGFVDRTFGGGKAWLTFSDLIRLLHEDGETCVPVIRRK
jgi:hypothetical protein